MPCVACFKAAELGYYPARFLGEYRLSRHAAVRAIERNIGQHEVAEAGLHASVIEDYPEDKYSPSCLLLGFTGTGRPLHLQVSRADAGVVKVITLYEPRPEDWLDYSRRR